MKTTHIDRRGLSVQALAPFLIIILTNLVTAYGTVQVLKVEIMFLTKTTDRHENEIKELRKEHGTFSRSDSYGMVAKKKNETVGEFLIHRQ